MLLANQTVAEVRWLHPKPCALSPLRSNHNI
jgi:hypothetical protein